MSDFMRRYFRLRYEDPIKTMLDKKVEHVALVTEYYEKKERFSKQLDSSTGVEFEDLLSRIYQINVILCEECYIQGIIDRNAALAEQK